jgi:hypothetical protein
LWPSEELVNVRQPEQPFVLPGQIGIPDPLGEEILEWTRQFQNFFVRESDNFESRPHWLPGVNVFDWYDEGYRIVRELRAHFPSVQVKPEFAQYVLSVNERREGLGLPPMSLPNERKAGYISVSDIAVSGAEGHPPI